MCIVYCIKHTLIMFSMNIKQYTVYLYYTQFISMYQCSDTCTLLMLTKHVHL